MFNFYPLVIIGGTFDTSPYGHMRWLLWTKYWFCLLHQSKVLNTTGERAVWERECVCVWESKVLVDFVTYSGCFFLFSNKICLNKMFVFSTSHIHSFVLMWPVMLGYWYMWQLKYCNPTKHWTQIMQHTCLVSFIDNFEPDITLLTHQNCFLYPPHNKTSQYYKL